MSAPADAAAPERLRSATTVINPDGRLHVRTLLFIVGGLFVFGLLIFTTPRADHPAISRTCLIFLVGWFLVAAGNMIYGVTQQGYGFAEELPIALLIFLVPAAPAAILLVRNRRG